MLMKNAISFASLIVASTVGFSASAEAQARGGFTVAQVLEKARTLQESRGWRSDHVEGGHVHFMIKAADGSTLEICPHPDEGLLHVMQAGKLPGTRLVVEVNLANEVTPYKRNPLTTFMHHSSSSARGLRYLADKAMIAIMAAPE